MKTRALIVLLAVAAAVVAATASGRSAVPAPGHVTIGYQPGIGYAPLIVLKEQQTLEKQFPNTTFSWKVLSSGAAVTTGVIAGDLQIGAGGTGPFLVGWAQGVDWKIVAGLDWGDLWLMAKDPSIKTVADLKGKRIAMPGRRRSRRSCCGRWRRSSSATRTRSTTGSSRWTTRRRCRRS